MELICHIQELPKILFIKDTPLIALALQQENIEWDLRLVSQGESHLST